MAFQKYPVWNGPHERCPHTAEVQIWKEILSYVSKVVLELTFAQQALLFGFSQLCWILLLPIVLYGFPMVSFESHDSASPFHKLENWGSEKWGGTSLVIQWLRTCLLMLGTWVWFLVWEDPTCCRATNPMRYNYSACPLEPVLHNKRSHQNKKTARLIYRVAPTLRN